MVERKSDKKLLICERDPGMQQVFDLMLGGMYELIFADSPSQIMPLLATHQVGLIIWDLDHPTGSIRKTLEAIHADDSHQSALKILRSIRQDYPTLEILLIAGEFKYDFQEAVIEQCGLAGFLTKPWESSSEFVERIQVILGDKKNPIRHWVLKMPLASQEESLD